MYIVSFFLNIFLWEKNWSSFNKKNNFSSFWCQDVHIFSNKNNNTNNINMYIPKKKSVERIKKTIYLSHCAKVFKLLYSMRIWVCKLKKVSSLSRSHICAQASVKSVNVSKIFYVTHFISIYTLSLKCAFVSEMNFTNSQKKSFVDI